MKRDMIFWLDNQEERYKNQVSELNVILNKIGCKAEIKKYTSEYGTSLGLEIEYDTQKIEKKLNRNAGRKKARCEFAIETQEIRERIKKGEKAETIANELGISRSTLFRKLKEAETDDLLLIF